MKRLLPLCLAAALVLVTAPAHAFVPQTIVLDGVNDFDPSNLLDNDLLDTQQACAPAAYPMDLGRVYVTNDASFLYFGFEYANACYTSPAINMGIAFDVNTPGGGTTDPWGRKIGWLNVPFKPDWVIYDIPHASNNWEDLRHDVGGTWVTQTAGLNALGIVEGATFKEGRIALSTLGVAVGTPMHLEFWITQDGTSKGPLDALASDDVQLSTPLSTIYDPPAIIQMTSMLTYTVLNAVDVLPPTVSSVNAVGFTVLANHQFSLVTNQIDVQFSEPVSLATAQTTGNYAFSGPVTRTVTGAVRDAGTTSLVHLTLSAPITANAGSYQITASNVQDGAGNSIVADGTANVRGFFIQNLVFNADMSLQLCGGQFAPTDSFAVEGGLAPLTFGNCDNAFMTDANGDSVYTATVPFTLARDPGTGTGSAELQWKLTHNCGQWEDFGGNRLYTLSSANGASVQLNVPWSDLDPSAYTSAPVDVVFQVDATRFSPGPGNAITLLGGAPPLTFTQPGMPMLDNGVAPDAVAGDQIYSARVSFPACAPKNFGWKVDFDGVIECLGQGDRGVFLDDALYSASTPLVLPARGIDRCNVTDKPVTVLFRLNMAAFDPIPTDPETVAVMGDRAPLNFGYPEAAAVMTNDGVFPDGAAGDVFFGKAVTFPDSTPSRLEYKYWKSGVFECAALGNRILDLDDVNFSTGSPQVSLGNLWDVCADVTSVPVTPVGKAGNVFAALRPVTPNPVVKGAQFSFDLFRAGRVTMSIYDISGRRVANVLDRTLEPGPHSIAWDGRGQDGTRLRSGVYLYELSLDGQRAARRMVLAR